MKKISFRNYLLLVSLLLSFSCCSRNNAEGETILLTENYSELVQSKDVFSVVNDAVRLQGDTSFVLNSIKKIVGSDDGVYLTDGTVICHYASDGRLMSRISHRGRGPGEYTGIMDFDVAESVIYVLDKTGNF